MIRKQNLIAALVEDKMGQCTELEFDSYFTFEDDSSFATIDGGVISQDEVALAVNKGAGIFIGNYYVGVTEHYQCYSNSPFGRYS